MGQPVPKLTHLPEGRPRSLSLPILPNSLARQMSDSPKPDELFGEAVDPEGEVFLIPYLNGFILYAPNIGIVMLISSLSGTWLKNYFNGIQPDTDDGQTFIEFLTSIGVFEARSRKPTSSVAASDAWKPTDVTFSTTQKCSLRCKYCYAEGGRLDDLDIPWPVAKAAIDLIIQNAVELETQPTISFLGEGEATSSWKEFTQAVDYYREQCKQKNLEPLVHLSTNGVLSDHMIAYVVENCTQINISVDGVEEVHDANRVLPNGKGSFALVDRTMRALDAFNKSYNIRSTVSGASVGRMEDFVRYVGQKLKCKQIHFEPVFDVTKVTRLRGEIVHPEALSFVENYRKARKVAARYGVDLYYSGSDLNAKTSFCGATAAKGFLVTSRGLVTSCNEVLQEWDPRAELFQYGRWNPESEQFEVDAKRIDKLARLNVSEMPKCQGCMAKYNCAGDCYARTSGMYGDPWAPSYTYRCYITRELLRDNLIYAVLMGELGSQQSLGSAHCML